MLGALSAWLDQWYGMHIFVLAGMGISMVLIAISYIYTAFRKDSFGVTSEYAAFVVYFLRVIAMTGNYAFAVILTIVLMVLLSSKEYFK